MSAARTESRTDAVAIFARVWEGATGGISVQVARHVVKLGFSDEDTARMCELSRKARAGELTDAERAELDNYVTVGDLLALLQSKARKVLKQTAT